MGRREIYIKCPCIYYFAKGWRQIIDKSALITSKIRERFFGKTRERTKNKGKKQAPSAVRQAAICALQNNISLNKIVEEALQRFLMLEN